MRDSRRSTQLWNALAQPCDRGHFRPEQLAGLPAPAQRFLSRAIQPGTRLASHVRLEMEGTIKLGQKWLPFRAEQILAPPRGLVWRAVVRSGLLRMAGADHYAQGAGAVDFWLWGVIPLVRASNPDTSRAARGRLAAESWLLPSSLLPGEQVRWRPVNDGTAEAVLDLDGEEIPVRLTVDGEGRLTSVQVPRWGDQTEDGTFALIPFGGDLSEEVLFGDYTIPTQVRVGWWYGTEKSADHEFFRARITAAAFR